MSPSVPPAPPASTWPEQKVLPVNHSPLWPFEARFNDWWPEGAPPPRWVLGMAGVVGLAAAVLVPGVPRAGVNALILGLAVAVPSGLLIHREARRRGRVRPIDRVATALGLVTVGLTGVAGLRASPGLNLGCLAAAVLLGAVVVLDVRTWETLVDAVPLFVVAMIRSLPWAGRTIRRDDVRARPWLRGACLGAVVTLVVAGLLAGADQAFGPAVDLLTGVFRARLLPARVLVFGLAATTVLGAAFAIGTRVAVPPLVPLARRPTRPTRPIGSGHPAEWLTPLVGVAVAITGFLVIEAGRLLGRDRRGTYAGRAHQGFGQLLVVTLIVLALLSWAGGHAARGPARYRRRMAVTGGVLLALTMLLAASSIQRLWLYQDAYGWTVTRIDAGAFETWVTVVLLGVAAGWGLRRTELLPRFALGSAGLGLLLVALAGPDALAATGNVHRFEHTHRIDTAYLSTLSPDAVPALDRLPEPIRSCALAGARITRDPWPGWNLSRSRADRILRERPPERSVETCPAGP